MGILQLSRQFYFLHLPDAFRMLHCHTDRDVIPLLICISLCGTTTTTTTTTTTITITTTTTTTITTTTTTTTTTINIPCKPLATLSTVCLQQMFVFQIEIWYLSNTINCLPHVMKSMKHSKNTFCFECWHSLKYFNPALPSGIADV